MKLDDIRQDGSRITALIGGVKTHADVAGYRLEGGSRHVSLLLEGETWAFTIPDPLAGRGLAANNENAIISPMTGVVQVVETREGACVKAGDRLIVIEAMKMEYSLTAPHDGTIAELLCAEGDSVESGAVLARLEDRKAEQG